VDARELRESVKKLEKRMERLTAELSKLDAALADPGLYEAARRIEAAQLGQRQAAARAELAAAEEDWLQKSERLAES
jgi:ATP-binding cassette, subfamily F, member 3